MKKQTPQSASTTPPPTLGPSRAEVRGRAVGTVVLAYFALAWTGWGMSVGVPTTVEASVIAAACLCFLVLVGRAVVAYRRAAPLPPGHDSHRGRKIGRRFGIIVAAEFIGLSVAAAILALSGHPEPIPTVVCLGVGIHFFPLRRLFNVAIYDRTGIALCFIAVATALVTPLTGTPALWTMLPGIGAALTLYITGALLLNPQHLRRPLPPDASGSYSSRTS